MHDKLLEGVDQDERDSRHQDIEQRVRVGDLVGKCRCSQLHKPRERLKKWKHDDSTNAVEQKVGERRSLAGDIAPEACQAGRNGRSNVGSQNQRYGRRQRNHALHGKGNDKACGDRRTLNQRSKHCASYHSKERNLAEPREKVDERLVVLQWRERI